jgi:hypothetical protein
MDFIKQKMIGNANINYMVDVSLEEGDDEITKHLILNYKAKPSLYAKQMAEINGYIKLAKFVETFCELRNNVSIASVHCKINDKHGINWNYCIPEQFHFI